MSDNERHSWNQRYSLRSHTSLAPDPFLVQAFDQYVHPEFPRGGPALDLAGGVGRHAIWLARRNWKVTLVDISEVGLEQAKDNAGNLARRIKLVAADLQNLSRHRASNRAQSFSLGHSAYDLVIVFFYLERSLFPRLFRALKPGGFLIYKTYTLDQMKFPGGPSHPLHLLKPNELLDAFSSLRILSYRETIHDRGVAELLARKQA
jgi:SAM-dependent methyltransferase